MTRRRPSEASPDATVLPLRRLRVAPRLAGRLIGVAVAGLAIPAKADDLRSPQSYESWVLVPGEAEHEVAVEGAVRLQLRRRICLKVAGHETCTLRKPDTRGLTIGWTVNGYLGGGPEIGQVRTFQDRFNTGGAVSTGIDIDDVVYTAPDRVPSPNPVAVAAVIGDMTRRDQIQLVTHVRVVDTPGWRGNIRVRIRAIHDPFDGVDNRSASENPVFVQERSASDPDNKIDLTSIESELTFTVTGVLSEAYGDNGRGTVVLEVRPQGGFSYVRRLNGYCERDLTIASGELDAVYGATPLHISLAVLPNGVSVLKTIPNLGFAVKGQRQRETCDTGFEAPFENFFDGVLIEGEQFLMEDSGDVRAPRQGYNQRLIGLPGNGRSFAGDARIPIDVNFGGATVPGEAHVSWSLSRK